MGNQPWMSSERQPSHPNLIHIVSSACPYQTLLYMCVRVKIKAWICKDGQALTIRPISHMLVL